MENQIIEKLTVTVSKSRYNNKICVIFESSVLLITMRIYVFSNTLTVTSIQIIILKQPVTKKSV